MKKFLHNKLISRIKKLKINKLYHQTYIEIHIIIYYYTFIYIYLMYK